MRESAKLSPMPLAILFQVNFATHEAIPSERGGVAGLHAVRHLITEIDAKARISSSYLSRSGLIVCESFRALYQMGRDRTITLDNHGTCRYAPGYSRSNHDGQ